jgi:hypothetical protein
MSTVESLIKNYRVEFVFTDNDQLGNLAGHD